MTYSSVLAAPCANPNLHFESFVTSEETAVAVDFAHRIVRQEIDCSSNPICFIAASGMGKTHLLSAISNASTSGVLMVDTVDLIREHQIAVDSSRIADFRQWILSWDLLLLDNIQHAQMHSSFQQELLVILERAARDNCMIVTTCDRPPSDAEACAPSVVSRFLSGVILEMKSSSPEARLSILQRELSAESLSNDHLKQIADKVDTNIRELKAAARQLVMLAQTAGRAISGEDIEKVSLSFHRNPRRLSQVVSSSLSSADSKTRDSRSPAFFEEILTLADSQEERSLALQIILQEKLRRLRADTETGRSQAIGEVQETLRLLRQQKLGEAVQMIKSFAPET